MKAKGQHSKRIRKMLLNIFKKTNNGYCSTIDIAGGYIRENNGHVYVVKEGINIRNI